MTDISVYNDHEQFSQSVDLNMVFLHMKAYFSHLISGVCKKVDTNVAS